MNESPCEHCVHKQDVLEVKIGWAEKWYSECEEAPSPPFMSEWGCWFYEKRKEEEYGL